MGFSMFISYVQSAIGVFWQHKVHFIFNMFGLALGLGGALIVSYFITFESSYDQFHPTYQQSYKLSQRYNADGAGISDLQRAQFYTSSAVPRILANYPETLEVFSLLPAGSFWDNTVSIEGTFFKLNNFYAASDNILNFIELDILGGSIEEALGQPGNVALSESEAERLFGDTQVLGERLQQKGKVFTVKAVFKNLPENTHFEFDILSRIPELEYPDDFYANWGLNYVKLAKNTDVENLIELVNKEVERRAPNPWAVSMMAIEEIHLNTANTKETINLSVFLSFLLIAIACFNYVNMSTALAANRAKEVGVRKTLGASRGQLIFQYLTESTVIALLAGIVGAFMAILSLPWFNALLERQLELNFLGPLGGRLILLSVVVGVLAGLYPALFLSSFNAKKVLSGDFQQGSTAIWIRKLLLIMQSGFAIGLFVATLILYSQIQHLTQLPVGYAKDNRVEIIEIDALKLFDVNSSGLINELKSIPYVGSVTPFDRSLSKGPGGGLDVIYPNEPNVKHAVSFSGSGYNVVETLGLNLLAGRDLLPEYSGDWFHTDDEGYERGSVIITESMLKQAGITSAQDAIGMIVRLSENHKPEDAQLKVVGVVEDIKMGSVKSSYPPMLFICGYSWSDKASVMLRLTESNQTVSAERIAQIFDKFLGRSLIQLNQSEEVYRNIYQYERRQASLVVTFCATSIFLTCIGVFGMAAYSTQRRSKEIAIRKALGAEVLSLINLIAKEHILLVLLSICISIPVTWFLVSDWLSYFNERIDQPIWAYFVSVLVVALITWLTVALAALKVALTKPAVILHQD